jgi:hypothetical protein
MAPGEPRAKQKSRHGFAHGGFLNSDCASRLLRRKQIVKS